MPSAPQTRDLAQVHRKELEERHPHDRGTVAGNRCATITGMDSLHVPPPWSVLHHVVSRHRTALPLKMLIVCMSCFFFKTAHSTQPDITCTIVAVFSIVVQEFFCFKHLTIRYLMHPHSSLLILFPCRTARAPVSQTHRNATVEGHNGGRVSPYAREKEQGTAFRAGLLDGVSYLLADFCLYLAHIGTAASSTHTDSSASPYPHSNMRRRRHKT